MVVDLHCVQDCQPRIEGGNPRLVIQGEVLEGIEIDGKEEWLKYFNAYEHKPPIKVEPIKKILIEEIGVADEEAEVKKEPTKEEIGAGPEVNLDTIKKKFTKPQMVAMLRDAGIGAFENWKEDTLAKKVQDKRLYVGKL